MSDPTVGQPTAPRRGRRVVTITAIALVGALTGAVATKALSHGFGHHHWRHGGGFHLMGGPVDPAAASKHAARAAKHLGVEIEATAEQQEKLVAIAKSAAQDLLPVREKIREARTRGLELMTQPSVDRAAVEQLRAEQMANMEAASKRLASALADAAEIMTPEQRKVLAERIQEFRDHRWRGWRKG